MRTIKKEPNNGQNSTISISAILNGTAVTVMVGIILSILAGGIYFLTSIPENTLPLTASIILCISAFSGGAAASHRAGVKGLYHGIGVGILFFIFVWFIAGLFLPGNLYITGFTTKLLLSVFAATAGGILGVGLSSK